MNSRDDRDVLQVLKFELEFIEHGGYGRSVRTPWRPTSVFQDSPSCLNFNDPVRPHPCSECLLIDFVPEERRGEQVPCHHIPLNQRADTVASAQPWGDEQEVLEMVADWLRATITRIGTEQANAPAPPKDGLVARPDERPRGETGKHQVGGREDLGPTGRNVLIIDHDERALMRLEAILENQGYKTTTAWGGYEAMNLLRARTFDLILIDELLVDVEPSVILKEVKRLPFRPMIMVTASHPGTEASRRLLSLGACGVTGKWLPRAKIADAVRTCLKPAPLARTGT